MMETRRDWFEKMHNALWAYHTMIHTFTNATPAQLVYGTEIGIPLHVQKLTMKFAILIDLRRNIKRAIWHNWINSMKKGYKLQSMQKLIKKELHDIMLNPLWTVSFK